MEHKRPALLVAYINSHFPELLRVARFLRSSGRYEPSLLYMPGHEPLLDRFIETCQREDIPLIDTHGDRYTKVPAPSLVINPATPSRHSILLRLRIVLRKIPWLHSRLTLLYQYFQEVKYFFLLLRRKNEIKKLLCSQNIRLLILSEDSAAYQTSLITKTGHSLSIPSVIVPYTIANAVEAAEHAIDNPRQHVRGILQKLIARKYPHWMMTHRGEKLALMQSLPILATELLNLAPPDPWMINSGFANAIAVESPFMMKYYQENGIPASRCVLTGCLTDDILYANLQSKKKREEVYEELHLDPSKPLLLCAYPPPWFPRPGCEFKTYQEMTAFWMDALRSATRYTVVISLHPRLRWEEFNFIEEQYGYKISRRDVAELIPLCDVYVANVSATIRWAIACGKPVLNYDVYKYRFHDYDTAGGVITVEQKREFASYLNQLVNDTNFLSVHRERQRLCQDEWGTIDGKSGERMLQLFDSLIQRLPSSEHI